jgi:hypothetical protein
MLIYVCADYINTHICICVYIYIYIYFKKPMIFWMCCQKEKHYLFVVVVLGGVTLWHLQIFLQYIKYITFKFTPSIILLYLPFPPLLEWFQQVSFSHLHTYIHNIYTIFTLLCSLSTSSPLPLVPMPRQDLFHPLVL